MICLPPSALAALRHQINPLHPLRFNPRTLNRRVANPGGSADRSGGLAQRGTHHAQVHPGRRALGRQFERLAERRFGVGQLARFGLSHALLEEDARLLECVGTEIVHGQVYGLSGGRQYRFQAVNPAVFAALSLEWSAATPHRRLEKARPV